MTIELTRHVQDRVRQRGYRETDLEFIFEHGTEMGDCVVLTSRDVEIERMKLKKSLEKLDRLKGSAIVVDGNHVLTVYRPARRRMKKMLRQK